MHSFSRTELLLGSDAIKKLSQSRVAVFGVGGVGSFAVEGLVRSGVGKFLLVDDDLICLTNLNRQLHATQETIGRPKVEEMKTRILAINPQAEVTIWQRFYQAPPLTSENQESQDSAADCPEPAADSAGSDGPGRRLSWADVLAFHEFVSGRIDYLVDAIDTVSAKIDLIVNAQKAGIRVISCMGAGNKLDPTQLEVADIYATSMCPLARVMRRELRKRGVKKLKVVYSCEQPCGHFKETEQEFNEGLNANFKETEQEINERLNKGLNEELNENFKENLNEKSTENDTARTGSKRRSVPGSVSFVPSVAGLIIAGEVIKDLVGITPDPCQCDKENDC